MRPEIGGRSKEEFYDGEIRDLRPRRCDFNFFDLIFVPRPIGGGAPARQTELPDLNPTHPRSWAQAGKITTADHVL
jgi:hypothetical protein